MALKAGDSLTQRLKISEKLRPGCKQHHAEEKEGAFLKYAFRALSCFFHGSVAILTITETKKMR